MGKIEKIVEIALRRGHSRSAPYEADFANGVLTLIHYGTIILKVRVSDGNVEYTGGYSVSDRAAIAKALYAASGHYYTVTSSDKRAKKEGLTNTGAFYIGR